MLKINLITVVSAVFLAAGVLFTTTDRISLVDKPDIIEETHILEVEDALCGDGLMSPPCCEKIWEVTITGDDYSCRTIEDGWPCWDCCCGGDEDGDCDDDDGDHDDDDGDDDGCGGDGDC